MKNIVLFFLFLIAFPAYSQKQVLPFCDGDPNGKYFPLDIVKKKIFWNDTYYFESVKGEKEFDGKIYTEFNQEYKDGHVDLIYLREDNGVVYQYREKCGKEFIKVDSKAVGQQWTGDCGTNTYKLITFKGKLKTPYCNYKNLLVIEAAYEKETFTYYYLKGYGYVGAAKHGKLYSCAVPEYKDHFEQNPFTRQNQIKEEDQSGRKNPFSKQNPSNTFAIKGFAFINLLDGGYGSTLGLEKGFLKNQSIGVKFICNQFTPHRENTEDGSYDPIDYSSDRNISFIFEYKYYFDFKFLANSTFSPYASLSFKTGTRTIDNDRDYIHDFYHKETKSNLAGPALGTLILSKSKRWAIDTQVGYLIGKKDVITDGIPDSESSKMDRLRFEILIAYNINW